MATNVYFNPFPSSQVTSEQLLVEDLVIEAMQIYGMDIFYLPRATRDQVDYLYGEDPLKQYVTAFPIEMYLENVTGMDGEREFISKFGLEIRDEATFLVSRRRFAATIPQLRPFEGDLIYIPLLQNLYEITQVEHENDQAMFYTLGRGRGGNVYVYALKLKMLVFSNEIIQVGISEIDDQVRDYYPRTNVALQAGGTGTFVNDEIVYQSANTLANATATAVVHNFLPIRKLQSFAQLVHLRQAVQLKATQVVRHGQFLQLMTLQHLITHSKMSSTTIVFKQKQMALLTSLRQIHLVSHNAR